MLSSGRTADALPTCFARTGFITTCFTVSLSGKQKIAEMINDWFFKSATDVRWDMHDPVCDGKILYARYVFSYRSLLPEAGGRRAMFEGVSVMRLREGRIADYREVANTGPGFVDMNFAPERIVKILRRQGDALKARPELARHLA